MARVKLKLEDYKAFHLRMPRETWMYVKKSAMLAECSMTDVVVACLEKQRKKVLKNLTDNDTDV
jgi:hypothetical protein